MSFYRSRLHPDSLVGDVSALYANLQNLEIISYYVIEDLIQGFEVLARSIIMKRDQNAVELFAIWLELFFDFCSEDWEQVGIDLWDNEYCGKALSYSISCAQYIDQPLLLHNIAKILATIWKMAPESSKKKMIQPFTIANIWIVVKRSKEFDTQAYLMMIVNSILKIYTIEEANAVLNYISTPQLETIKALLMEKHDISVPFEIDAPNIRNALNYYNIVLENSYQIYSTKCIEADFGGMYSLIPSNLCCVDTHRPFFWVDLNFPVKTVTFHGKFAHDNSQVKVKLFCKSAWNATSEKNQLECQLEGPAIIRAFGTNQPTILPEIKNIRSVMFRIADHQTNYEMLPFKVSI